MTYKQIATMIEAVGIPCAYYQFEEGTGIQPPFITFYYSGDNDVKADNINFAKVRPLVIELYTEEKDFTLEETVESVLTANDLAFSRTETYIDSEKMFMVTYYTEVNINA